MPLWSQPLDGVTESSPAVAYGLVYVPTDKNANALNATDGSIVWSFPVKGERSVSSPAVADGKVFFGLDNGYVYALDAYSGSLIWDYKTGGAVQSSPAVSDGLLFVGSNDGCLYAIGKKSESHSYNSIFLPLIVGSIGLTALFSISLFVYSKKRKRKVEVT